MKQPILILSSLLCVFGGGYVWASDSLEEEPLVDSVEFVEENNTQIVDAEYLQDTMDGIVKARTRLDDLLVPCKSSQNLWTDDAFATNSGNIQAVIMTPDAKPSVSFHKKTTESVDESGFLLGEQSYYGENVYIINNFLNSVGDNVSSVDDAYTGGKMRAEYADCPFATPKECAVWRRKPVVSESVAPRSRTLRDSVMCDIGSALEENPNITATNKVMTPLLQRYKVLMRVSQSCCTGGIMNKLKMAGMKKESIYRFLTDDANFSGFGTRCVVMDDTEIAQADKRPATSATIADVRNECICKSKNEIRALLAPFEQLYADYPEFADAPFEYRHYDGVGRAVTDSINTDVQNVLHQLEQCP